MLSILVVLLAAGCGTAGPASENVDQVRQATGAEQPICLPSGACYAYSAQTPVTIYVAPAPAGSNSWTGTLPAANKKGTDGPLATFEGARQLVQKLKAALNSAGVSAGITVQFRGGTYYLLQDPLLSANFQNPAGPFGEVLTADDSGSASIPITYEAYGIDGPTPETPIFSGGLPVSSLGTWTQKDDTWQVQLPQYVNPPVTPNLAMQPFENIYYNPQGSGTPFGQRRLRPRVGGVVTGSPADSLTSYLHVANSVVTSGNPMDPNATGCSVATGGTECTDRFYYNPDDLGSLDLGAYSCPDRFGAPFSSPADVELVAFELWTAAKLAIQCVDPTQNVIYLTQPIWQGQGDLPPAYGYKPNHRYLIENLQSAFSQPGQWFLDKSVSPWVLKYRSQANENPPTDTVVIPQLKQVLVASGLQNVTFSGLHFAHDDYVVPPNGFVNTTQAPAAVSFQNTTGITFGSGSVSQTAGTGLEFISCIAGASAGWCYASIPGVPSNNLVQNSAFWDLGSHGIRIGDDASPSDTPANVACSNTVQNNVISGYGRVFPDSNGINQGTGHDNRYHQNTIHDGYKGAIRVRYVGYQPDTTKVFPDNNTIDDNLVYDLFQGIMNDGGSLYFGVGDDTGTGTGNVIENNVVHDVTDASILDADGYGGDGLYADEWTGDVLMQDNLVYRVSGSAVTFAGPHPYPNAGAADAGATDGGVSVITNNIFAYARTSMMATGNPYQAATNENVKPPAALFFKASQNIFYFDRDASSTNPCVYSLPCEYTNSTISPNPNPFYVQGGMAYPGSVSYAPAVLDGYTGFEVWSSNTYFRSANHAYGVDGNLASDGAAFHTENPTLDAKCEPTHSCVAMTIAEATAAGQWPAIAPTWNLYSFSGWQPWGRTSAA